MTFQNYIKESKESTKSKDFLKAILIKRFHSDKKVTIKELEQIATKNNVTVDELNLIIYDIVNDFLFRSSNKKEIEVDKKELELGIKHELEHTDEPEIAKIIALDHLYSVKNYYSLLKYIDND
jgi:hypothetical protein